MGAERKVRLRPINRQQLLLRPVDVERLVAEDHPARAVWEFVGRLDLGRFYAAIEAVEGEAGRSATDPRLLMSLWIYAYSEGVGSAREIERLCGYHPAYQWLTGMEVVNHHTLSDFRVDHKEALDELFAQVLGVLSAEGLITLERVMHDGTKVRANAGVDTFRREERIRAWLDEARRQVQEMGDPQGEELSQRVAKARQRAARERKQRLEQALEELEKARAAKPKSEDKQQARVSVTDPQARVMKQADGGYAPSYNVQISTDAAAGAIVGVGATQAGSDYRELEDGVERVEENLGSVPKQLVADGGFTSRDNILAMHDSGIDFIGSLEDRSVQSAAQLERRGVAPEFWPHAFVYEAGSDTYTCPAGKTLHHESKAKGSGKTVHSYRAPAADCLACPFKARCCPKTANGRSVCRSEDHPAVAAFMTKMQTDEAKAIYRQRGPIAEFPNLWIKAKIGLRQFRLRGLRKVGMEALWAALTYDIQLWIRLRWNPSWAT